MLSTIVFLPLLGLFLCAITPKDKPELPRLIALLTALVDLVLVVWLIFNFDPQGGYQFVERHTWIGYFNIEYALAIDGIALAMLVLSVLLSAVAVIAAWNIEVKPKFFFCMLMLLEVGMNGVFLASDMILFYLFWELVLIPMYFLISQWGGPRRAYAALKFFLYTFFGSVFMLIGIIVLFLLTGSFNMQALPELCETIPLDTQTILFFLFFLGFGVKVPIWPFHTWLPDAHVEAPTAVSAILAGVLLKMGLYGFARVSMPMLPDAFTTFSWLIALLSVISIIYGAIAAYAQSDVKKLVAYSSVSHMGFAMLGLAACNTIGIDAALAVGFSHGLISALLFLTVGMIYDRTHTREIARLSGICKQAPGIGSLLVFASIAAAGIPGMSGFIGEFLSLVGAWNSDLDAVLVACAFLGVLLGAVYMISMVKRVAYGEASEIVAGISNITTREILCVCVLVALIVLIGINWNLFLGFVDPTSVVLISAMEV